MAGVGLFLALVSAMPPLTPAARAWQGDASPALEWSEIWGGLDRLVRATPGSRPYGELWSELDALQTQRERAARKVKDGASTFRARVLRAHLSRLKNASVRPVGEPGIPIAFLPGESWLAAQVLGPGNTRVRATAAAIAEAGPQELDSRLELGLTIARDDAQGLRLDAALQVARAVAARSEGPESALALARICGLRGEYEQADEVLRRQIDQPLDPQARPQLLFERGLQKWGAGQDAEALRCLGSAFARGEPMAGARLGCLALLEGGGERARALFRALLDERAVRGSAWRGWGLALLGSGRVSLAIRENRSGATANPEVENLDAQTH